jgi:fructan beta-fructosidase
MKTIPLKRSTLPLLITSLVIGGLTLPQLAAAPKAPAAPAEAPATREIKLTGKLLLYPVAKDKKKKGMLSVRVNGALIHNVEGSLAQSKEDVAWWAYLDMNEYVGKTAALTFSLADAGPGLALIESSDQERHLQPLYEEPFRPQFHHSQKQGWNNDPNGMVWYDGQCYLTAGRQPQALDTVSVKTEGGSATVESLEVFNMKSIWKK